MPKQSSKKPKQIKPSQNITGQNLDAIRHTASHVLAYAVKKMFPGAKFAIGPVIENGFYYDFDLPRALIPEDLPHLEKSMREIIKQNLPMEKIVVSWEKAFEAAKKGEQKFKVELLEEIKRGGREAVDPSTPAGQVTFYRVGEFTDLCKGNHARSTGEIPADAFKLTHVAGAYWKGDEKREQLQRVYGVLFETKAELEKYLWQQEEAKKRDHRVLGQKLQLFAFAEEVGPGLPLWLPKGTLLRDTIEDYAKEIEKQWGYVRVATPHIAKETLFKISGHIPYYTETMYPPMKLDDGNYYLKAMNCPHTHMIYKAQKHSYRELPLRYAEYGTVYRYELSGVLAGLLRVRGFTQNDAHIYCREDQAEEEFLQVMKLHDFWYKKVFGIRDFYMRLSLPAYDKNKFIDMPEEWNKTVEIIRRAMKRSKVPFVEAKGEAAFYGPKVDFQIKSVIGREETASTNQLDFLAAHRFHLSYTDKDGQEKPVYVIHRAPLGSHERFIGFLIEQYGGAFPLWLAPVQAVVLPVSDKFNKYAQKVADTLLAEGLRTELDDRAESVGKKIRDAELQKIPYMLVVGEKEQKAKKVNVRKRDEKKQSLTALSTLIKKLKKEIAEKK